MDLLMKLETQAEIANGYVHALIGNHEAMNIYGDIRYVHPGECAAFMSAKSADLQKSSYMRHIMELYSKPPPKGVPRFDEAYKAKWEKEPNSESRSPPTRQHRAPSGRARRKPPTAGTPP